jgi:GxxExxY protein
MDQTIVTLCNAIYNQLGSAHNECVYQKALVIELYNHGAHSVEYEKHVPVFFTDVRGTTHTIGSERVDILAYFPDSVVVLIELKAHTAGIREHTEIPQLKKYIKSLAVMNIVPTVSMIVNFPQKPSTQVEHYVYIN